MEFVHNFTICGCNMACIFSCACVCGCWALFVLVAALVGWKLYMKYTTGVCKSNKRLDGKTVIVTGSNAGIGKEAALDFARRRARVILACRDVAKAEQARDEIVRLSGNKNVVVRRLDLTSLTSVRQFAKEVAATEDRLDVLVNNAGVAGGRKKTDDGLVLGMQVNHFGPFLLTNLLLDLIKKNNSGRIIFVSSLLHKFNSNFDVDNLNWEKGGSSRWVYNYSKLCNILNANELARRLKGTGITVNSLHPGAVHTDIWRHLSKMVLKAVNFVLSNMCKSPYEGAQTTIYLAVSEEVEGVTGKYFSDCKEAKMSDLAADEDLAKRVWEKSEQYVASKTK